MPQFTRVITRTVILILIAALPPQATPQSMGVQPSSTQSSIAQRIVWEGKPSVSRYRLQLARDEQFFDIVLDKIVLGREYTVTDLPPGSYFWRVAPAARETGRYSQPLPVAIRQAPNNTAIVSTSTLLTPPSDIGWQAATGLIVRPVAAKLRADAGLDLVGVNAYGMVYALDGSNGIALWSARYRPDAKRGEATNSDGETRFAPLLIKTRNGQANVVAAFDGGVRALEGATGRELWRTALSGEAISGAGFDSGSEAAASVLVIDSSRTLYLLKGDSGQILSQTRLEGTVVGQPAEYDIKGTRGVILALDNGTLEGRNMAGVSVVAVRLDSNITTGPLMVTGPRGRMVMMGTESGLVAFDAKDLNPLWRIATEGDAPQGVLAAADLDRDGNDEVIMITRRGRTVVVNVSTGKIKWFTEGATDAAQAAIADINRDGTKDVLVAGGEAFALGFSGRDGALIWKADDTRPRSSASAGPVKPRSLVAAPFGSSSAPLLVGTDPGRTGVRAVGLPADAMK